MEIYFMRHGEDKGSVSGIFSNEGLTSKGINHLESIRPEIENLNPEIIITSPMIRAIETTRIVNKNMKIEIKVSDLIVELNGNFINKINSKDYHDFTDSEKRLKGYIKQKYYCKYGETYSDLFRRVKKFWNEFEEYYNYKYDRILIISHGRFLTFLISHIMKFDLDGYRFAIEYGDYLKIKLTNEWRPQISFNKF